MHWLLVVPALPIKTCTLDYFMSIINDQISIMISIKWSDGSNRLCGAYFPSVQLCLSSGGTWIIWNDLGCEVFWSVESLLQTSSISPVNITVATETECGEHMVLEVFDLLAYKQFVSKQSDPVWSLDQKTASSLARECAAPNEVVPPSRSSSCVRRRVLSPPRLHQEGQILFCKTWWLGASFSKHVLLQSGVCLLLEEL